MSDDDRDDAGITKHFHNCHMKESAICSCAHLYDMAILDATASLPDVGIIEQSIDEWSRKKVASYILELKRAVNNACGNQASIRAYLLCQMQCINELYGLVRKLLNDKEESKQ